MKMNFLRLMAVFLLALLGFAYASDARVEKPITLSFSPKEGYSERYMTVLTLGGSITEAPNKQEWVGLGMSRAIGSTGPQGIYRLRTVYRDSVESVLRGMNRHRITFYDFNILDIAARRTREEGRPGAPPGAGPAGGGGGGGASKIPYPESPSIGWLPLPSQDEPMQGILPPGGGGGAAPGGPPPGAEPTFSIDNILVTELEYIEGKNGDILDIGGQSLDLLREYSRHAATTQEGKPGAIKLDLVHVFEWTHLLRLPDYPVWREDLWFATVPITVPGLNKPIPMKFIYRLVGFTRVGMRELAIIDVDGIENFHEYWEEELTDKHVKYEAMGSFSIAARYLFDYKNGTVFGIERPPIYDLVTLDWFPGTLDILNGFLEFTFAGLVSNLEMRYYTEETEKKKRKYEKEPQPKLTRRYVALTFFLQSEAE